MARIHLGIPLVILALEVGCSSDPLPLAAQQGASFALLLNESQQTALPGFGGEIVQQALDARGEGEYVGVQRSELVLTLKKGTGPEYPLVTRVVTRVWPDPASDTGIANQIPPEQVGGPLAGLSQAVALVDVPLTTPADTGYTILVKRRRRTGPGPNDWTTLSGTVNYGGTIDILPSAGAPSEARGWLVQPSEALSVAQGLASLHPHPKVVLDFGAGPYPAAARVVVTYPATKAQILTAFENDHLGRGSAVRWSSGPAANQVTIHYVDPDASIEQLALAFELVDPFGAGRVSAASEFVVESALSAFYDADGVPIAATLTPTKIR
jgi:hypothetical protein